MIGYSFILSAFMTEDNLIQLKKHTNNEETLFMAKWMARFRWVHIIFQAYLLILLFLFLSGVFVPGVPEDTFRIFIPRAVDNLLFNTPINI